MRLLRDLLNLVLKTSMDRDGTTSLGKLFHYLTAFTEKVFPYIRSKHLISTISAVVSYHPFAHFYEYFGSNFLMTSLQALAGCCISSLG